MTDRELLARFEQLQSRLGTARALRKLMATSEQDIPHVVADVVAAVEAVTGVEADRIMSREKTPAIATPRFVAWWLLHRRHHLTAADIARAWGCGRSVPFEALEVFRERLASDAGLRALVAEVEAWRPVVPVLRAVA